MALGTGSGTGSGFSVGVGVGVGVEGWGVASHQAHPPMQAMQAMSHPSPWAQLPRLDTRSLMAQMQMQFDEDEDEGEGEGEGVVEGGGGGGMFLSQPA